MAWVPLHTSGLTYVLSSVDATLIDSVVSLPSSYPTATNSYGVDHHWAIVFGAGQGNPRVRITVTLPPGPETNDSEYGLYSNEAAAIETVAGTGPFDLTAWPIGGLNEPMVGFYAGDGEKADASEYLVEVWIADAPAGGGPTLVKDIGTTVTSPYVAAQPALSPIAFHMYATPLPLGWRYKAYTTDGVTLLPNDLASFNAWPAQIYQPREFTAGEGTVRYTFMSTDAFLAYLASLGVSSVSFDQASPVYNDDDELTGYLVWTVEGGDPVPVPPAWWGPLDHMTFVTFPDNDTADNGYPLGEGAFRGYVDIPTTTGITRCWGTYWKDHRGVLLRLPEQSDPLPPLCTLTDSIKHNPARVVVLANFPGRAAVPAVPVRLGFDFRPGWNAGATSETVIAGDCRVAFTPYVVGAVAVGLTRSPRPSVVDHEQLEHAFLFDEPAGGLVRYCILERGRRMTVLATASSAALFEIERVDGAVSYKIAGAVVYTSLDLSSVPLCVGACLFYGGDGVY